MRKNTVVAIIVVIVALVAVRAIQEINKNRQKAPPGGEFAKILPEGMRAADIQKIEIYRGDKRDQKITLERTKDGWGLPSRFNSKGNEKSVTDLLDDMKKLTGEVRTKKASLHKDFGITADKAVHIALYDKKGKLYQDLLLGKKGERYSEGFVRLASSDKVYLADKNLLTNLGIYGDTDEPDAKKWLDLKIIDKKKEDVAKLVLDMPGKQVVIERQEKKKEEEKPEEAEKPDETQPKKEEEKKEYEWVLTSPKTDFKPKDTAINSLVSSISQFNGEDVADPAKMNEYGFDTPTYTATVTMADNTIQTLLVGKKTEKDDKRYARLKDTNTIYVLPQYTVTGVFKKMRDLLEMTVWDLKKEDVASINLFQPEYEILLEHRVKKESETKEKKEERDYEWVLVKPETRFKLEEFRVTNILSRLIKPMPDDMFLTTDLQAYGLDSPQYKAVMKMSDGSTHTLLFGKKLEEGDDRYVAFEGKDNVYTISKYNLETIFSKLPRLVSIRLMEDLTRDSIVSLKYDTPDEDFILNRKEGATPAEKKKWAVKTEKEEYEAKSAIVDDALQAITLIRPQDLVLGKADADCGLDKPSVTLVISTDKTTDHYTLFFGNKVSQDSTDRYFKIKDQPDIFTLSDSDFKNIFKKLSDLKVEKPPEPKPGEVKKPAEEQKPAPSVEKPPAPPIEEKKVPSEEKPAAVEEKPKEEPAEKKEEQKPETPAAPEEPAKEKTEPSAPERETPPAPPEEKKQEKPTSPEEGKPAPEPPTERPPLEKPKEEIPETPIPKPSEPKEPLPLPAPQPGPAK
jgi:hypothetical protein